MSSQPTNTEWTVATEDEGERLDRFLAARLESWSRSKLQSFVRDGLVTVGERTPTKPGTVLAAGERVRAALPEHDPQPDPDTLTRELAILHEDEDVLVVDKPTGLLSHRTEGGQQITLAELADAYCGPLPSPQGERRPGIVHRLDRETSGVMVLGKTQAAMDELMRQFREREVTKTYAVIVAGTPRFQSDWIEASLGRNPRQPDRMDVVTEADGGRTAATFYEVQERLPGGAYVFCKPKTGRTHQIRVHLTSVGLEVVGDKIYRVRGRRPQLPREAPNPRRQMLHALRLELKHPTSGAPLTCEAPLPEDFAHLLTWLRSADAAK